jgi:hypothetical protein
VVDGLLIIINMYQRNNVERKNDMKSLDLKDINLKPEVIVNKREIVRNQFILQSDNIDGGKIVQISNQDLELLFQLYDEHFFGFYFKHHFKGTLLFSLSKRMTRAAGKTIVQKNLKDVLLEKRKYEIRMGFNFFFKYDETSSDKMVCGIKTKDALEAFQMVFEHELCHFIEFYLFQSSSCKQKRFQTLAKNIFDHTDTYHALPTNREIAGEKYDLHIGDFVSFHYEEKQLKGFIHRINKRAVVMVKDQNGMYIDKQGKRYTKYHVPLTVIRKI